jgi:hypothetical protein
VGVAHLAVEFRLRHQRSDRVNHQNVDGIRAHQRLDDLQRLLAVVRLRDQQVVDIYAELTGISWIESMLGVNEGSETAGLLRFGDDLQGSGPKISMTRPRGTPPTPKAASKEIDPVEMTEIGTIASFDPRRITEPLPNCFSSCESAVSIALLRSSATINTP